ncbi:MAG: magnesium chelatase subunit [Acidobacteriota bacterium]|jgi:magnesium chelatase subunit D|nr:magnesium chelatase subunit [Acidobacteriota bacterium]
MAGRPDHKLSAKSSAARTVFPFTAIVGQEEMKLALLLNVVAPSVGGVLITGHRGTGKSTAVRALADLLPPLTAARGCTYNCDPSDEGALCNACLERISAGERLKRQRKTIPVVELPLGATEDRVCGTIDLGRALKDGVKSFEPGLLARANRGFLYIDEVNLLEDYLVDLLLDVAATGRNRVEREGISAEHPSRFVLVGSCNPEEGELRPQLLDRFGLCVEVETIKDLDSRVRIVEHREAFDQDPSTFNLSYQREQTRLRRRILRGAQKFASVKVPRTILRQIAELCMRLGVDGHRGEITLTRAARALAALEGRGEVSARDVRRVAPLALRHRLRRDPLEQGGEGSRVDTIADDIFGESDAEAEPTPGGKGKSSASSSSVSTDKTSADDKTQADESRQTHADESRHVAGRVVGSKVESMNSGVEPNGEGRGGDGKSGDGVGESGRGLVVPPVAVLLRKDAAAQRQQTGERRRRTDSIARRTDATTRRRAGARKSEFAARGRYAGASPSKLERGRVAIDATLRAAAGLRASAREGGAASLQKSGTASAEFRVAPEALRFKRFSGKAGALFIFLVDTSGSMAVNRIAQAKGALAQLLRRSYVNRDRVSLIAFREGGSELLLAPCASASRARALLDALPVGGATPLAAGLVRALEVTRRARSESAREVRLVVFTDGRANVPLAGKISIEGTARKEIIRGEILALGASLREAGVASLVIDTQSRFTVGGEGQFLSDALGGRYLKLPQLLTEAALLETVASQ